MEEESYYTTSYHSDSFDELEVPIYFPEDSDTSLSTTEEEERDKKLGKIYRSCRKLYLSSRNFKLFKN